MPIYDYKCSQCEKIFEVQHKAGDIKMKHCPSCGGSLKRVFSPLGIVFKGTGFHNTDYGKTSRNKEIKKPDKKPKSSKS